MFGNVIKQAGDYLEKSNIKEKMINAKDKTLDKVKGIDDPTHYTAPPGFTLFTHPVSTLEIHLLESFQLKEKMADASSRLPFLLKEGETVIDAITANMKKMYLIVWTNQDRILIVHKEHYLILNRDLIHTLRATSSSTFGLNFDLNELHFTGNEKSKTYRFIRNYCQELVTPYTFVSYEQTLKKFNFYERLKYKKLNKENQAVEENKQLCLLMEPFEFPLVSVYGTDKTSFVLMLSTNDKLYLINKTEYTILNMSEIKKIEIMNQGMFQTEFYMDNYYFTNSGPEHNVLELISYFRDHTIYENKKKQFLEDHKIWIEFPFLNAYSYQTPSGIGIIISEKKDQFLICSGPNTIMYRVGDLSYYELIMEEKATKDQMWTSGVNQTAKENKVAKEVGILNYSRITLRLILKDQKQLELPLILTKLTVLNEDEQTSPPNEAIIRQLLDQLDTLKGASNEN